MWKARAQASSGMLGGDSVMLVEMSPAARPPGTAGRGGQGHRGVGGWVEGAPGALRLLNLILKELPGCQPGSVTPEQREAGRAARRDFNLLRIFASHRAVFTHPSEMQSCWI